MPDRDDSQPADATRSRLWFERLAEATPDIIFVLDIVRNRNVYASRSLGDVLGYSADEFRGLENVLGHVIPEPDLDAAARFYAAMRTAQRGEVRQLSHRARHRNGSIRWIENRVTPFSWDEQGLVVEVIGVAADVTARHELEDERARLATLIEHSVDFIAIGDLDGTLTYMNSGGRRLIGLDPSHDVRSVKLAEYVPPEWLDTFRNDILPTVVEKGIWEGEMQLMHLQTGARIDVARSTYLIRDPDTGQPVGFGTVTRDITHQKRAEEELRRSEELVRTIAENSTLGFAMMDARGYCTYANHAWLAMTGYTREEIGSKPLHDLVHHHYPDGRPYPMQECPIDRALPENFDVRAHEDLFFRKDGTTFPVVCAASPIFKDGRPVSTVIEIRDVSEARRAAAAQRESEEQFRTLADHISQLAWMAHANGDIFWFNRRWFEYTGTTLEEMRGWGWRSVHHPDHLDRVVERFRAAVENGTPWEDTFPLRGSDGTFRWFLSRALPIRGAGGEVVRWFGTNTDITELRDTQEALRRADRLKDDFLATLSHELRTPLTSILGWTDLLRAGLVAADDVPAAIDAIHAAARAQTDLVEDLLDVSRITSGQMRIERRMADPRAIVYAALATVAPAAEAKAMRIDSQVEGAIGEMYVDPDRVRQILWNLLSNAIKFSPPRTKVELTLRREGEAAVFEVRDEGPGIAPELMPHLFERFRQGDSSTRRSHGGLGIGLSLVKELALLHGGRVVAESEPGQGALFRVTLPIVIAGSAAARPAPDPLTSERPLHGVHALIVDDDDGARVVIGTMLQKSGGTAATASGVDEALDAIARETPDVVITDIAMPGRDGRDLLASLRADARYAGIPVVAVTAHPGVDDHNGFSAVLEKPVTAQQLASVVREVLADRRRPGR